MNKALPAPGRFIGDFRLWPVRAYRCTGVSAWMTWTMPFCMFVAVVGEIFIQEYARLVSAAKKNCELTATSLNFGTCGAAGFCPGTFWPGALGCPPGGA